MLPASAGSGSLFEMAGTLALAGWAVLIFAPRRITWLAGMPRLAIPLALSALYSGIVMVYLADADGGFGSLADVRALFASDPVLLAGWTHYLAFDLIVGSLLAARLDAAGIHRLLQAPVLVTVFLLGPLGFLLGMLMEQTAPRLGRFCLRGV